MAVEACCGTGFSLLPHECEVADPIDKLDKGLWPQPFGQVPPPRSFVTCQMSDISCGPAVPAYEPAR